jgi:hypothetical protein
MIYIIKTVYGNYLRRAWTGGDTPPPNWERTNHIAAQLYSFFLEEQIADSGGLDFWACAGTSAEERLKMFENCARLDAWATFTSPCNKP